MKTFKQLQKTHEVNGRNGTLVLHETYPDVNSIHEVAYINYLQYLPTLNGYDYTAHSGAIWWKRQLLGYSKQQRLTRLQHKLSKQVKGNMHQYMNSDIKQEREQMQREIKTMRADLEDFLNKSDAIRDTLQELSDLDRTHS